MKRRNVTALWKWWMFRIHTNAKVWMNDRKLKMCVQCCRQREKSFLEKEYVYSVEWHTIHFVDYKRKMNIELHIIYFFNFFIFMIIIYYTNSIYILPTFTIKSSYTSSSSIFFSITVWCVFNWLVYDSILSTSTYTCFKFDLVKWYLLIHTLLLQNNTHSLTQVFKMYVVFI